MIKRPDLVSYLKFVLGVGDTNDSVLNSLTEEQLQEILILQSKQLGFEYPNIPQEYEQIVICLSRKEIYWKMAIVSAPLYQLDLDGLKVTKNVRFDHYMALIQEVTKEYEMLLNDPNRLTVKFSEVSIDKYYTRRKQYINYSAPQVHLNIDNVGADSMDLSIDYGSMKLQDFVSANIYIGSKPLYDKYEGTIIKEAIKVKHFNDVRTLYTRIHGLELGTPYNLLLEVKLKQGITVYAEASGVTLSE